MSEWLIAALCLVIVLFVYWVGTGAIPGMHALRLYRYARRKKNLSVRAALAWVWNLWLVR